MLLYGWSKSPKTHVGSKECEKLHGVIISCIGLKISRNFSGVFPFLNASDLNLNGKPTIHNIKRQGGVLNRGPGAYFEDLKPVRWYPPIWKMMERFQWQDRSLSERPKTKYTMLSCNMEFERSVLLDRHDAYLKDLESILRCRPEIWNEQGSFLIVGQVFIWKTWSRSYHANP